MPEPTPLYRTAPAAPPAPTPEPQDKPITVTVQPPDRSVTAGATRVLNMAREFVIDCDEMLAAAGDELRSIKTAQKDLNERRMAITRPLDDAKKAAIALFQPAVDALAEAENVLKRGIGGYQQQLADQRRAEEARRREAARIEQERLAAEARAQREAAEKARREAEEAAAAGRAEEAAKATAAATEAAAQADASEDLSRTIAEAPVVVTSAPKVSGVSMRETWSAEVDDLMTLVKAVAEGKAPLACLQADMKVLNAQARALKAQLAYPGVRAVSTSSVAARSA